MNKVKLSLLHLISTPVPVLNSLGVETSIGLSSEDPMGGRRPSESYQAYLSIYSPDGRFFKRLSLGEILPRRRKLVKISDLTRPYFKEDHLTVMHRIPSRLLLEGRAPEDAVELTEEEADYVMFRGFVQYSYPGGGNGSVIYETPQGLNARTPGRPIPSTLTFTAQAVLSRSVNACFVLIYYSVNPDYDVVADYRYSFFAPTGKIIAGGTRKLQPFTVQVIDAKEVIPPGLLQEHADPADGLACFGFTGYTTDGIVMPIILSVDPERRAVAVEHTHPPQSYTIPARSEDKYKWKGRAISKWKGILPWAAPALSPS